MNDDDGLCLWQSDDTPCKRAMLYSVGSEDAGDELTNATAHYRSDSQTDSKSFENEFRKSETTVGVLLSTFTTHGVSTQQLLRIQVSFLPCSTQTIPPVRDPAHLKHVVLSPNGFKIPLPSSFRLAIISAVSACLAARPCGGKLRKATVRCGDQKGAGGRGRGSGDARSW